MNNNVSHDRDYEYYCCDECRLIFLSSRFFLNEQEEKAHYDTHENNPSDDGYRRFLSQLADPLTGFLCKESIGLDFGAGPGPTLSLMLEERGFGMRIYDPVYSPDMSVLESKYDFITCTETIEHFKEPGKSFRLLWHCLKPGGYLGLMTQFYNADIDFTNWRYRRDPTHVCFYQKQTIDWVCREYSAQPVYDKGNVVIVKKLADN